MKLTAHYGICCILITLTGGCMDSNVRQQHAANVARQSGFTHNIVTSNQFAITTYQKQDAAQRDLLVIYIEGDGQAWLRKGRQSADPTPKIPIALQLAVKDPHPSVVYIARPCQYLDADALTRCNPRYWSTARYSETVIDALGETINKTALGYKRIGLVGYSGGGTVAMLIAARRKDVDWIMTIAANLDHEVWTRQHNVTPLIDSLNAVDYAVHTGDIPQLHLVGDADTIVPVSIVETYMSRIDNTKSRLQIMPGYDHQCCWVRDWPEPVCQFETYTAYCGK